jgi:hypothetical protein
MNYHCSVDLPPEQDLTVDAVKLFQRFRQQADVARVETLLDAEFTAHLRLCELVIARAASADIFWAVLPEHPFQDINIWVSRHLEKKGFTIDYRRVAREEEIPSPADEKTRVKVMVVRSSCTAKWHLAPSLNEEATAAEWRRRTALEDEELARNPPQRQSRGLGTSFESGDAVWASVLDGKYVVEIQRRFHRSFLCLFGLDGKFLHAEKSIVSYGAMFGPDAGDVAQWEQRAQELVDNWKAELPPA